MKPFTSAYHHVLSATIPALALANPAPASAQTWSVATGTISALSLSFDTNYAFRTFLQNNGTTALPNCKNQFIYINNNPGENYQAKVASLLNAYNLGKVITIYYLVDSDGYCQMKDISL